MTMKLEIAPEVQAGLLAQAQKSGLSLEAYVQGVLREKSRVERTPDAARAEAVRKLATFGKRHKLSLGDLTVKELLRESRP